MEKKLNKIDISDEVIDGTYANLAIVTHSPSDFVIDFALAVPGRENPKVKSRIILSPEHAKRILFALQDNIKSYENQFGKIETLNEKRDLEKIISPFSGGEA